MDPLKHLQTTPWPELAVRPASPERLRWILRLGPSGASPRPPLAGDGVGRPVYVRFCTPNFPNPSGSGIRGRGQSSELHMGGVEKKHLSTSARCPAPSPSHWAIPPAQVACRHRSPPRPGQRSPERGYVLGGA